MVKISVIIPIYNGEKYLSACLDSITEQTLKDIEIICINDGSTDNTLSVLSRYASQDKRIKIISTENKGQGSARNSGLEIAEGEYIGFVDADDWINQNTYESLYLKAKENDLEMLFFQLINYMEKDKHLVETDLYNHVCFEKNSIDENSVFNHETTKDFLFEIPVCPVSKLYKKEFLDKNELKFPEGIFFEDNAFFYDCYFKCEKAGFLKKQFYYRRRHEDSVTQKFDRKKFDIIEAANLILDVFKNNKTYSTYKNNVINHTFSMILEWFKKSPLELKDEFFTLIKNNFKGFNELKGDFESNLNEEYLNMMFKISLNNKYYLDFLTEYKLNSAEYKIYDSGKKYELNSIEYNEYKKNSLNNPNYKITIIIPIYNNEKIIHRTLMSIEHQTFNFEDIEVLLINDASQDKTKDIINRYCDKYNNFKAIHIKKGTGSSGIPRNIGIKEASADYIMFLDHDDLFEINALETLYNSIINKNCDISYGTYVTIDKKIPTKIIYPKEKHYYFKSLDRNERAIAFPPPSIWTRLFKKSLLIENNILFPPILGEDAVFISKALTNAKGIDYLWDNIICYHDLSENSYTNNISLKYLTEGFVSEEYMYNLYKDIGNENYYKIRGEGILDFYLTQFIKSNLNIKETNKIFPLLYKFTKRCKSLGLSPHVNERNIELFKYILEKDLNSIFALKGLKEDSTIKTIENDENIINSDKKTNIKKEKINSRLKLFRNNPEKALKKSKSKILTKFHLKDKISKKRILYVLHSGETGGTFLTNRDLMKNVEYDYEVFVLGAENNNLLVYQYFNDELRLIKRYPRFINLNVPYLEENQTTANNESNNKAANAINKWSAKDFHNSWLSYIYFDILINYEIDIIHIRHLINHSFDLVEIAKKFDIPVVLSMHDFYFICPFYTLLDENNNYCEGKCSNNHENCYVPMKSLNDTNSKKIINVWRVNVVKMFSYVDYFITTSNIVKDLFLLIYPDRNIINDENFKIIEHGRDFPKLNKTYNEIPSIDKPVKILSLANNLNIMKGSELIKNIKKEDKNNLLEFHFLGNCQEDIEKYGINHGKFERDEFNKKVLKIKPSFVGIFSIWPETFCHTITESWSCGIPVIGTNIGVIEDRITKNKGGWIIDRNNPKEAYDKIIELSKNKEKYLKVQKNIKSMKLKTSKEMAIEYLEIYNKLLKKI